MQTGQISWGRWGRGRCSDCLYGGWWWWWWSWRGSALSAWISWRAQLSSRDSREAPGALHLSDPPSLHPLVPHLSRSPAAAPQTCQTRSSYPPCWRTPGDDRSNRKQATERRQWSSLGPFRTSTWTNWRPLLCLRDAKQSPPRERPPHSATGGTASHSQRCVPHQPVLERLHSETSSASELTVSVQTVPSHGVRPEAPPPPEGPVGHHPGQLQGHREGRCVQIIQRQTLKFVSL